ncbi:MAG: TorF family putative porin [Bdellovibrionaceae bacterium]|nr:TorF family putative porin [Pseudobdellovibrionaceae bacterium]
MSPRSRFSGVMILVALSLCCARVHAQSTTAKDEFQPGKLFARVAIATNHVEQGLTQTEGSPVVQTTLGYKWEQFQLGLWGSNVKFTGTDDSVNLRLFAAYRFIFTSNADLTARYDFNRYYNAGTRNGAITGLDLNLFKYHVMYDRIENWEGTGYDSIRYGFEKEWELATDFTMLTGFGYNMLSDPDFSNYFDVVASLGYRLAGLKYEFVGTYNSASGQFGSRAGPFFFLRFSATF